ncbi:MAG: sugar nucleotide-binding protein [Rhodobacterales bacterium]|nr:sugar nucleotide-binding protein [Rhodobacterales bacterium]
MRWDRCCWSGDRASSASAWRGRWPRRGPPVRAVQVNVMTSLNVLQAARAQGVPVAYLSTAGVFGPQDARHPRPMTVYGVTKLAVEGPPLRIPADLASDPVPADYGAHPVTRLEDGIAATLAELR